MNPEIEQLVRENNEMLKKMKRSQTISKIIKFVYLAVIILAGIVAFSFIQPYVESLQSVYGAFEEQSEELNNLRDGNSSSIQELLNLLGK